jgi:hypothetical protein
MNTTKEVHGYSKIHHGWAALLESLAREDPPAFALVTRVDNPSSICPMQSG